MNTINQYQNKDKYDENIDNYNVNDTTQEYCLVFDGEDWFIQCMIVLISIILVIIGTGIFLLFKQRNKYPIKERSYMLSIYMMYCFCCLSIYYPIVYIVLHFETTYYQNTLLALKWIYIQAQYGLYISYFTRSMRIYAAFTKCMTNYFSNENQWSLMSQQYQSFQTNQQSNLIKWIVYFITREWLLIIITAIISNILCIPLIKDPKSYLIPIENYHTNHDLLFPGDLETAFAYQLTIGIFVFQIYILRKVPKHYRFHRESILNFITQWTKASLFFFISNLQEEITWCSYRSQINITFNYFQFISMIYISTFSPLLRSQYVPAPLPFPQLANFNEFIEDEGDDNNIFCNRSFIAFLDKKDKEKRIEIVQQQQQKEIPLSDYRQNLNIYEFYFETKAIQLNENDSISKKVNDYVKLVNFYIFTPEKSKYLLKFPFEFNNSLGKFTDHYIQYSELIQNYSNQRDNQSPSEINSDQTIQNQFIEEIEEIQEQCIKYLKDVFEEYIQTNAFNYIKEYYEEQKSFQTNLKQLQLFHDN